MESKDYTLFELKNITEAELEALPTISKGHFDDLKIETGNIRVWLSRMTKEDGHFGRNISYEKFFCGRWTAAWFCGNILTVCS
jgi:hypothetical protein